MNLLEVLIKLRDDLKEWVSNIVISLSTEIYDIKNKVDTATNSLNNKIDKNSPSGSGSLSLNRESSSRIGNYSCTTGYQNVAEGSYSSATGYWTKSLGLGSVSEGYGNINTAKEMILYHAPNSDRCYTEPFVNTGELAVVHDVIFSNISNFVYNDNNGYWESQNHEHYSYGLCRIDFKVTTPGSVVFEGTQDSETYHDFAIFSNLNTHLDRSNGIDSASHYSGQGKSLFFVSYDNLEIGSYFIEVKYRKDSSVHTGTDKISFKLMSSKRVPSIPNNIYVGDILLSGIYTGIIIGLNSSSGEIILDTPFSNNDYSVSGFNAKIYRPGGIAFGTSSHAEGYYTNALGNYSHSEGYYTTAFGECQQVQGKYNIHNKEKACIVGNGKSQSDRSNAHTLDWDGTAWFAGDVYIKSSSGKDKDTGSQKLATEEYIDIRVPAWDGVPDNAVLTIINGKPAWKTTDSTENSGSHSGGSDD